MKKMLLIALVTIVSMQYGSAREYKYMNQKDIYKAIADNSIASCFVLEWGNTLEDTDISIINIDNRTSEKRGVNVFKIRNTRTWQLEYFIIDNYAIFNQLIDISPTERRFYWFVFELDKNRVPTGKKIIMDARSAEGTTFGNGLVFNESLYIFKPSIGFIRFE